MTACHDQRGGVRKVAVVIAGMGLLLTGCSEVDEEGAEPYQASRLVDVGHGLKQVTFTAEGARRVDLKTAASVINGTGTVVEYAALIYDEQGASWVYTAPSPLTYLRASVVVDRIEGNRVFLSKGPPAGTKVVTVGAAEVFGAESDIAGGQ
jgi:hypothetical protein